jgi:hypothetical protein
VVKDDELVEKCIELVGPTHPAVVVAQNPIAAPGLPEACTSEKTSTGTGKFPSLLL